MKGNGKRSYGEPRDKARHFRIRMKPVMDCSLTIVSVRGAPISTSVEIRMWITAEAQAHGPHRNLMGVTAKMNIGEVQRSSCTPGERREQQNRDKTSLRNWGIRRFTVNWGDLSQGFECNLDVKLKPSLPTEVKFPYGSFRYWHLCKRVLRFYYILIYLALLDVVHPSLGINKSRKIKNCK